MARKDLEHAIATRMLTGPGLEVLKRTNETMLTEAMKAGDADAVEALGKELRTKMFANLADAENRIVGVDRAKSDDDYTDSIAFSLYHRPSGQFRAGATSHSPESITSTIAALESLTETLPAVLTVANGWAPADIKFHNRDAMHSAVDMLRKYREMRRNDEAVKDRKRDEVEREQHHILIAKTYENGVKTGIEQEQARVKEAHKGRKRGAKKS